jgi:spore coat protein H
MKPHTIDYRIGSILILMFCFGCTQSKGSDGTQEGSVTHPDGWESHSHDKGVDPDYGLVFDDTVVRRLDITIDPADYEESMDDLDGLAGGGGGGPGGGPGNLDDLETPIFVPVNLEYNGLTWWHVGMRYKGNSSLHLAMMRGVEKLAFRFNFDMFEDDHPEIENQRFYGFKKMTFSSGFNDPSLLRDKIAADVFREAGVPAAMGAFVRVYVDHGEGPIYFGLYTMIEDPSDELLGIQFGDDSGNLYKPDGEGASWQTFIESDFEKKTNEDSDWSDVISAIDALHATALDAGEWREELEEVFNVDAYLRCLAVNQVMVNWDSYGAKTHNYYLYADPSDEGRIVWFPWDLNEAMLVDNRTSPSSQSILMDDVGESWPLIRYLLDDSEYRARYLEFVREAIDGAFAEETVYERLDRYHSLISPYVSGPEAVEAEPYTFLDSVQDFESSIDGANGLREHVAERHRVALAALEAEE